jgi:hypothetical protein
MAQLICERCRQPINSIEQGYVEWRNRIYDSKLQSFDFQLVHHLPYSPFGSCYRNTGHDYHLGIFVKNFKGFPNYDEWFYKDILSQIIQKEDRIKLLGWHNLLSSGKSNSNKTERNVSKSTRFKVLKRDNYRCRICGVNADNGASLEVDHIKPLAKGGSNSIDNLWTLCDNCNRGKSATEL